jgi:hypothetical protein
MRHNEVRHARLLPTGHEIAQAEDGVSRRSTQRQYPDRLPNPRHNRTRNDDARAVAARSISALIRRAITTRADP